MSDEERKPAYSDIWVQRISAVGDFAAKQGVAIIISLALVAVVIWAMIQVVTSNETTNRDLLRSVQKISDSMEIQVELQKGRK